MIEIISRDTHAFSLCFSFFLSPSIVHVKECSEIISTIPLYRNCSLEFALGLDSSKVAYNLDLRKTLNPGGTWPRCKCLIHDAEKMLKVGFLHGTAARPVPMEEESREATKDRRLH